MATIRSADKTAEAILVFTNFIKKTMTIRRVVTGHSSDGKSVIASDEGVAGFEPPGIPGHVFHMLWGADGPQTYPDDGALPDHGAWFAPVGGVRFVAWTVPPDSAAAVGDEAPEALEETERLMPGLLGLMEPDTPGFHRSDTTDLIYIVSGRIMLQLDDGVEVEVKAGDAVIQNGTRHAWRNPGSEPCKIIGLLVGAERSS